MIRPVLRMGDSRLLRVSHPVADPHGAEIRQLLADMRDTMARLNGAGLAAPQIGVDLRVVIFGTGQINPRYPQAPVVPPTVLINPCIEIVDASEEGGWEGCLSVPGLRGWVPRYRSVRYRGTGEFGEPVERTAAGFHARVVQHECDHLDGWLYPMRMRDLSRFGFVEELAQDTRLAADD